MTLARIVCFVLLVISAATGPVPLCILLAVAYALVYPALELLVLAACIDAYYGSGQWPQYLLGATALVFVVEFLRPHIKVRKRIV